DNLSNSDFPDQFIAPTDNAEYTVKVGGVVQGTFTKNQRLFANDLDDGGIGFELFRDTAFTVGAGQTLRIELRNLTGTGDKHVVAGPMLLVRTSDDAKFRIQNNRDPVTLAAVATPGFTYTDDPGVWTDLVYKTGGGNDPLWESATLRPVFRELFTDWLNGTEQFPDLGDTTTTDPNDGLGKLELASHATPFGPVVPDHTLQIPIPQVLEDAIVHGLQGLVDLADTIEGIAPLQIKIPVINKSLAELANLKSAIQENVQQPIVNFFTTDPKPHYFSELFDVISPSLGTWDANEGSSFEFALDLRALFAKEDLPLKLGDGPDGFGIKIDGTLDVGASLGFVDALNNALPKFAFGVDLANNLDLEDRFYIRAEDLLLHAEAHAAYLDLVAHLGFLWVGVQDGKIDFDADVKIDMTVLDADNNHKITLNEITDNFADLDPKTSGTLAGELPLVVAMAGVPASPGKVTFGATDIFNPDTYHFDFTGINADALDFGNLDAAGIVTMIAQVADQLDTFRKNGLLDNLDIPLVGTAVDEILNFADTVRRGLLYDPGDDGEKDGADRLATDLNAALEAANLGNVIIVQGTGTKLRFVAIDPTVEGFTVSGSGGFNELGFGADAGVFDIIHEATPTKLGSGIISADAVLQFTIKRAGVTEPQTPVTLAHETTKDNVAINRLATDLNAALKAADLDNVIVVQGAGTKLRFVGIDPTVEGFKVAGSGGFSQLGFDADAGQFKPRREATPADGIISADAVLQFTIKRTGVTPDATVQVTLDHTKTTDNVAVGDDTIKLVRADNSATFDSVQGLIFRLVTLAEELGIDLDES